MQISQTASQVRRVVFDIPPTLIGVHSVTINVIHL